MMRPGFHIIVASVLLSMFWLQSCQEKPINVERNVQYVSGADEVTYIKLGKEITDTVGKTLKGNLIRAMKKQGPQGAVRFCNIEAIPLSVTYSEKYDTELRRVSDRVRNSENAPNEVESAVISDYRQLLKKGEPLSAKVAIDELGRKHYYAPIMTGGACLTCHGSVASMQPELVTLIDSLYPNDRAKGFNVGDLRGIWSIRFRNS